MVTALVAVVGWLVVDEIADPSRPSVTSPVGNGVGAAPSVEEPPVATLLAVAGDDGTAAVLTVLVAEPGGGGALVYVPTGTMVEVPSFGLEQVGQSLALGGLDLVRAGLENLFGVQLGDAVAFDTADLGRLVPDGELTIDLPTTVEARTPEGRVEVLWPAGPIRLTAADAAAFLTERGDETELGMLVRHHLFWSAVLEEAGSGVVPAGPLAGVIRALAAGEVEHHTLPVESLGPADLGEADLYRVDRPATAALVERTMSDAPSVEAVERTRVQVLNGTGEPGQAREVTAALVPAGAEVVVVGNADRFDHTVTQVVFYDRDEQSRAEAIRDALGVGEVVFSRHPLDVVDVTVVVGSDFAR